MRALRLCCALACILFPLAAGASEHRGQVVFNGLPVPGATITATQGAKKIVTVSDGQGYYGFTDLPDGVWKIDVEMLCFASQEQNITVGAGQPGIRWDLKMLPLDQVLAQTKAVKPAPAAPVIAAVTPATAGKPAAPKPAEDMPKPQSEESAQANDGLLVNGSVNNAATSQFSLAQAFGNTRKGTKSLYTGGLGLIFDSSALDARAYSISGLQTAKPSYSNLTLIATFGGPIRIPHIMPRGPNFFLVYQGQRNSNASGLSALVPTDVQRSQALAAGGAPAALVQLYPTANLAGNSTYNYQNTVINGSHQDAVQLRMDKQVSRKDQLYGTFALQSTRADSSNIFGFRDTTDILGIKNDVTWQHRLRAGLFANVAYHFSRLRTSAVPYFQTHPGTFNASLIQGADQAQPYAGPPTLNFSSGIASLTDGVPQFNRNRTEAISPVVEWYHGRHNVKAGIDFRRQEYNVLQQSNPRGSFTFTGQATGSDYSDFLANVVDTAAVAYGNPDKYFRQSVYDVYANDDWRLRPDLTLNVGFRWEYGAPMTELKNRIVNLDVAPGFTAVAPVLASNPVGPLTGQHYPTSLLQPDKTTIEPRLGVSWRPIAGSSLVVRGGYGIYADTSIYLRNISRMAVQPPLARNMSVSNSAACPLSITNGLTQTQCDADTFGVDPNFRTGYAQAWQLSAQRDLPFALQATATYMGVKGSNGVQQYLPNSYALGGTNPCPSCPSGFYYRSTNGTSSRNAGSLQLRRRLRSGFTASVTYTWSKSVDDDAALGGQGGLAGGATTQSTGNSQPAQNWRDLHAERSLSTFDQRHLLTSSLQYTSGMGLSGGTLLAGWRGRVLKEWTIVATIDAGSGLPENPVIVATVPGTGETGLLRPDRTSSPLYTISSGHFLNASAFSLPVAGKFGNAGRNSIEGPGTFTFNASLARTFRLDKKFNLDIRADATNLLNHVVYTAYNTSLNPATGAASTLASSSPIFGLPISANAMRSLQLTARLRF